MSISNTNNTNSSNASSVVPPSMQDLMTLLQDQLKVISSLQRTIGELNIIIKNLNGKIEKMEADKNDKISINVTTSSKSSKSDLPKTVHENVESPKCLGKSNDEIEVSLDENVLTNQHQKTVHEKSNIPEVSVVTSKQGHISALLTIF